jgi:hypothetical protein
MELSARKTHEIERQNAALRAQLRTAKRKIRALEREIGRSERVILDQTELELLGRISECDVDNGFPVEFAADLTLAPARLDYHLQRLVDGGYVELLFTDSALGDNFGVTQRGRHALIRRRLL